MLDMNLQRFSEQGPTNDINIPNGLPDKPGPKLVSVKGKVNHLVVVLDEDYDIKAKTQRALEDGNVPALLSPNGFLMTWSLDSYIGFSLLSGTELLVTVGKFDNEGMINVTSYIATIAKQLPTISKPTDG